MREAAKQRGMPVMSTEGEDNGEWIIVDCGAAVAHIMQPAVRDYYHLEEIWGGKPVKMKVDGGGVPARPRQPAASAKSVTLAAKKARAAAKAPAARKEAATAKKPAPIRKAAPTKKTSAARRRAPAGATAKKR